MSNHKPFTDAINYLDHLKYLADELIGAQQHSRAPYIRALPSKVASATKGYRLYTRAKKAASYEESLEIDRHEDLVTERIQKYRAQVHALLTQLEATYAQQEEKRLRRENHEFARLAADIDGGES